MRHTPIVRNLVLAGALGLATLVVAGCDSTSTTTPAAGVEWIPSQDSGFESGYETFCTHGSRVIASSGGGLTSVPADPSCRTP